MSHFCANEKATLNVMSVLRPATNKLETDPQRNLNETQVPETDPQAILSETQVPEADPPKQSRRDAGS